MDIEDENDQPTIHLSHLLEIPPYNFYIVVRNVMVPVTAVVAPVDGSLIEINTQDGRVTVIALPGSREFREVLRNSSRSSRSGRSKGWRSRGDDDDDQ